MRTLVIVNPRSRNGATGRRWHAVEGKLRDALGAMDVERTRGPGDAERIAREGVRAGVERLVVAGGDGTLGEATTGLLAADLGRYAELGLLPLGTGGDFARTLAIPRDLDEAIACLSAGRLRKLDAGRVTRPASGAAPRYFANVASFGISGLTVELVNRTTKALGGTVSFLIGALRSVARFRSRDVSIRVDGALVHEGPLLLAAVANGRYFGGGMCVAPEARPDDGLFDVVAISEMSAPRVLVKLPTIYLGRHLGDAAVSLHRGRLVEAEAVPGTVPLELDGDALGSLPVRIELLPAALSVRVPSS